MTGQKFRTTATTADQDWAANHLELRKEIPHSSQWGSVLERLEDMDFMPPGDVRDAVSILAEGVSTGAAIRTEERTLLIERLNHFVRQYWELPVFERQKQYQDLLSEAGQFSEMQQFLHHLESGLAVDATRLDSETDADVHDLGRTVCAAFLAGHADRVAIRRRWQSEYSLDDRQTFARQLSNRYPAIAALDEAWIQRLLREESHFVPRKKLLTKVVRNTSKAIDQSVKYTSNGPWLIMLIGITLGVLSTAFRGGSSPDYSNPPGPARPSFEIPQSNHEHSDLDSPEGEALRRLLGIRKDQARTPEGVPRTNGEERQLMEHQKPILKDLDASHNRPSRPQPPMTVKP